MRVSHGNVGSVARALGILGIAALLVVSSIAFLPPSHAAVAPTASADPAQPAVPVPAAGPDATTVPRLLKDINLRPGDSNPQDLFAFNGALYFQAYDAHGSELWKTDGTAVGTVLVKDIAPGLASSNPYGFTVLGSELFFLANDGVHGWEMWKTNGTTAGTVLVADIWPGIGSGSPDSWAVIGGKIYFVANDGTHGWEPWVTDGTAAGTHLL